MEQTQKLEIHGWTIYAHSLFLDEITSLMKQVEAHRHHPPPIDAPHAASEQLAAIAMLAFQQIPQDPARVDYHHGNRVGRRDKHWRRVKFFGRYRLFFRYHQQSRVIVYAWIDDNTKAREPLSALAQA